MVDSEKRVIFVHVHIPKSGDSTFQGILRSNFRFSLIHDEGFLSTYQYSAPQIAEILRLYPWVKCYSSHKASLDLPFNRPNASVRAITFVRDPVDRFISHYFYHRNHTNHVPATKDMNFEEYIEYALAEGRQKFYLNGQTLFLTGTGERAGLDTVARLLEKNHLALFPLKRFDESCVALEAIYPKAFTNCAYAIYNQSTKDQAVTQENRDRIRSFSPLDFELCQMADAYLDRQLTQCHSSDETLQAALSTFKKRCKNRSRIDTITQKPIRFASRLAKRALTFLRH